ncbi:MAG: autotransporter domain-containing protein [Verrucomicrobia bacterium]|nr:autotransporter domain-containing protein [Verrucomicrobiota bacterium]
MARAIPKLPSPRRAWLGFTSPVLLAGVLVQFVAMWAGTHTARAQETWILNPTTDFNTAANWSPPTVPTGPATAIFAASNTTNITFSADTSVGAFQFNAGAPAYSFSISPNATNHLHFTGAGIVNNSSNLPTLTNTGNEIFFVSNSSAGNAIIVNQSAGQLEFENNSNAGTATITNNSGSDTIFVSGSSAGSATITINSGAFTEFQDSSTANNATVITNSGGTTGIEDTATGGNARFITNAGGILDISHLTSSGTTVGSIEGAGTYQLGSKALTVGQNNLSTEVSGTITDGGSNGGVGASLIKVGSGTLTLSGTNTYTGGTTISAGTLQLGDGGITGSIVGNVIDNATLAFDRSNAVTFAGVISGTGNLTQIGSGTTILTGNNTYNSGTTISQGTLQLGNGGTTGSIVGNVVDNGVFAIDHSNSFTFTGVISGSGAFQQLGTGETVLTGSNTYSGTTTVNAGTLAAGSPTAFSPNSQFSVSAGATLDLNGFNSTIGSLTGGGLVINGSVSTPVTLTLGGDNSNTTFSGVIGGTGLGTLALTKIGGGTLILTGANVYTGGTTIDAGTLQIGNGGTTGSIRGNVRDNGTFAFDRSNAYTFSGQISGKGSVVQSGSGALTLSGANTYSGGTTINAGTLIVDNARALGRGDVALMGGILTADPQPINVRGNYFQGANGTLQLHIAGANPGQYDFLNVTGNATLGGTLQLINQSFAPKAGDTLTLVKTGGVITNTFAHFIDPFTPGSGFNTIDLVYSAHSVELEFLNKTTPIINTINFASFAQTPNQLASAELLDAVELDPKAASLVAFFLGQPLTNIPGDLVLISPEALTSFYEFSFSGANLQRLTLENHLDEIRAESGSLNPSPEAGNVGLEKGSSFDGKSAKNPVEPVLQPVSLPVWNLWASGFGDFVNVDSDSNARGYRFTNSGFDLGFDYRFLDHFAVGVMGNYTYTWADLRPGSVAVNSGRGGLYATYFTGGYYLNLGAYGGYNTYDSNRRGLGGNATGNTDGAEWSGFISTGYDFHHGALTIGPIASLQYTNVYVYGFREIGSLVPMSIHSDSEESLRSDLGFRAFYQFHVGSIVLAPYLKATWEHEFKYSALPVTASLADFPGPTETFFGPVEGQDSAIVSTGLSVQWTPRVSSYVGYDGQFGRGRYNSNAVNGGVRVSW